MGQSPVTDSSTAIVHAMRHFRGLAVIRASGTHLTRRGLFIPDRPATPFVSLKIAGGAHFSEHYAVDRELTAGKRFLRSNRTRNEALPRG